MSDTFTIEIPGAAMRFLEGSGPMQQWEEEGWPELNGPVATSVGRKLNEAPSRKVGFGEATIFTGTRAELLYLSDMCSMGIEVYDYGDKDSNSKAEADGCRKAIARIRAALA